MTQADTPAVAIDRLRELATAATPGPWRWEISLSSKSVELCGGPPKSGFGAYDHSVMSFRRWGLNGAAPVFWSWEGQFGTPKRADEVAVPVEGREHHASWFRQIDDPNAAYIAAANPAAILSLITAYESQAERLREVEGVGAFLLDRLTDFETRISTDEDAREFHGHVSPAASRFRSALQSRPATEKTDA